MLDPTSAAAPAPLLFSEMFFRLLVFGSLIGSALGLLALLFLLRSDQRKGTIW